jgi:3-methyladenine DNA glycosylase AlkD
MDAIKHTYDTESDAYAVPRELMIEIMEKLEGAKEKSAELASKVILSHAEKKKEEIDKLKKENDSLHRCINIANQSVADAKIHLVFQEDMEKLKKENNKLKEQIDDMESEVLDAQDSYALQKQTDQVYYHGEPLECIEDGTPITISDVFPNKFIGENKKLKEEIVELKSDAENSKAFWECFMDCKGNPDNPTKLEMIQWCDDNNKSDEIREYITEYADDEDSDDEE